ncbi:50S ribosomal protein L4 [Cyphellophora europaea CBS 101466]|uniref:Large ribosomal subunit protein uL4m n=1 Tax=Cyphellophora europaea (strain CBS 101466) TaxID=1220924 RepID=W2S9W3_CYPE1|nr:50S ribosomal protein L4 [Cyphellophora europaea CBS 101466]ETN44818.1 50S ribosomal protein L4 [Cyphellophora europaea CBS 101466]
MSHQTVGRSLLGLARGCKRIDPSDPLSQCLAPRISRTFATQTDLPIDTPAPGTHINPNVAPHLYAPPKVLTTLHAWPSLEPSSYAWYGSQYLDVPLRRDLLHRAVIYEGDAHRRGTASTKWREDVHGSGKKIAPQKGLGRARVGDKKSPIRRGGGVAHGPKPRDFSTELPRKVYDKAWRTALSYRYRKGELVIVDGSIQTMPGQTARFLANWFEANQWGKGFGRSLLIKQKIPQQFKQAMAMVGKHGLVKDVEDVDVKDMLETGRVVIEKSVLDMLLLAHSSDIGVDYNLEMASRLITQGLEGSSYASDIGASQS